MPSLLSVRSLSGLQSRLDSQRLHSVAAQTDTCLQDSLRGNVLDNKRWYRFAVEDRVEKYQQIFCITGVRGLLAHHKKPPVGPHSDQKPGEPVSAGSLRGWVL